MPPFQDLTGKTFGRLKVISRAESRDGKTVYWNCICNCGNQHTTVGNLLKNGRAISCGCYRSEASSIRNGSHHMTGTVEYRAWRNMLNRCCNPKCDHYNSYGGRGITVCDRWLKSFENFLEDMGLIDGDKRTIDRIDNNKGYSPDNCRWATLSDQAKNKTTSVYVFFENKLYSMLDFCKICGISRDAYRKNKDKITPEEMYYRRQVLKKRYLTK